MGKLAMRELWKATVTSIANAAHLHAVINKIEDDTSIQLYSKQNMAKALKGRVHSNLKLVSKVAF